ncbi:PPOX class F420-dependent oxidoreductase [Catenuloplanes japonicus]|uniref:PPOX class F420-dependent oxidoreductase n=1 Tax=Catenuloplanes japonicus TaxID=33876 RepID=UPI000524E84B|nr:PPOX class F420-dependent oxidoreductase [Catenuloplanes japonicus]
MSAFTDAEIEYLRGQQLGRLASAQPNGTIQNNPVGYGYNSALDTIDIGGHNMSASRKFRNVEAGSVVAFVVDDIVSVSPWRVRMLEIRGTAEALSAPADSEAHMPGPIIRIHPRRIISYNIVPDAGGGARNV